MARWLKGTELSPVLWARPAQQRTSGRQERVVPLGRGPRGKARDEGIGAWGSCSLDLGA